MDDAVELEVCQGGDQAVEVGRRVGIDSEFVFGDPFVGLAGEDQSGAVSFGSQEGAQLSAGSMTIGQDEPVTWGFFRSAWFRGSGR